MTIAHLVRQLRLRSAARQYARRLGPQLRGDYGVSEQYTVEQFGAAARKLGLPLRYLAIGYATFLPEHAFAAAAGAGDRYDALRALVQQYVDPGLSSVPPGPGGLGEYDIAAPGSTLGHH